MSGVRCPECRRFVNTDAGEVEITELTVDLEEGTLTISAELTRNCAECGEPLLLGELHFEKAVELRDLPEDLNLDDLGDPELEEPELVVVTRNGRKLYGISGVVELCTRSETPLARRWLQRVEIYPEDGALVHGDFEPLY